ncbi:fatty acid desaturase [Roseibium sp. RKSG952]|uniref:fatty acid desaturase family protein n=1 Tax=Roseibium sp. RKSG952 TaxID=2529384 RepID=UPI0018AD2059|nr:fatty acid desaturase [Roseibium sp. RKSG952]
MKKINFTSETKTMSEIPNNNPQANTEKFRHLREISRRPEFSSLNSRKTIFDITLTLSILIVCTLGATINDYFFILNILLLPPLYLRLFCLGHEAAHTLISRNRALNDFVGLVSYGIILMPFYGWRAGHLNHHMHTDHPVKEEYGPVSVFRLLTRRGPNPKNSSKYSTIKNGLIKFSKIVWKSSLYDIGLWRSYSSPKGTLRRKFKRKESYILNIAFPTFFWALYIGATILSPLYAIVGIWIPQLIGHIIINTLGFLNHQDIGNRISYNYHSNREKSAHETIDVDYGFLNWFTMYAGGPEHTMHHLLPQVPWYNLRKLREAAASEGAEVDRHLAASKAWVVMWQILMSRFSLTRISDGYKIVRNPEVESKNSEYGHADG